VSMVALLTLWFFPVVLSAQKVVGNVDNVLDRWRPCRILGGRSARTATYKFAATPRHQTLCPACVPAPNAETGPSVRCRFFRFRIRIAAVPS